MTTQFPGAIDGYTDPVGPQTLATNHHKQRHIDLQDAMVAVQTTVGVSGSADPNSIEYRVTQASAAASGTASALAQHAAAAAPHSGHSTPSSVAAAIEVHEMSPLHTTAMHVSGAEIAFIGDSQAYGYWTEWGIPVASPGSVPTSGVYVALRGAEDECALSGTGQLEVLQNGSARWTAPGDTAGPWTICGVGKYILPSGSANKGLHVFFWRPPEVTSTISVVLQSYRTAYDVGHMSGGGSLIAMVMSALGASNITLKNLATGGAKSGDVEGMIGYFVSAAGGPGYDVIVVGTNDIAMVSPVGLDIWSSIEALLTARLAIGRRVVFVGIGARFASGTTPLSVAQQNALMFVNGEAAKFCDDRPSQCRFVDALAMLADAAYADCRPYSGVLRDEVHYGYSGIVPVGGAVIDALRELGADTRPRTPERPAWNDLQTYGRMLGNSGTPGAGTTTVGGIPTGWSSSNTASVTTTIEVVLVEGGSRRGVDIAYASSGGSSQYGRVFASESSLSALNMAVGDYIEFYGQIRVITAASGDQIVAQLVFVGAPGKIVQLAAGAVVATSRLHSPRVRIPTGTTALQLFIYCLPAAGISSGRAVVSHLAVRKIS